MEKQIEDALKSREIGRISREEFLQVVFEFVTIHPKQFEPVMANLRSSEDDELLYIAQAVADLKSASQECS